MSQNVFTGSLTRIARSIMQQKYTGILFVERVDGEGTEQGKIHFENGSPVRAYSPQGVGKAALQHIGTWKEVSCTFQSRNSVNPTTGPVSVPPPIHPRMSGRAGTRPIRVSDTLQQTGPRVSLPETAHETRQTGPMRRAWYGYTGERETNPLHPRQAEIVTSAHGKVTNWQTPGPVVESTPLPSKDRGGRRAPAITRQIPQITEVETMRLPAFPAIPQPVRAEEALPGRSAVFQTNSTVAVVQAIQDMERRARIVFILVNGQRTIADIARLTHQTESEVEQTLVKLTQRGYTYRVHSDEFFPRGKFGRKSAN